MGSSTVGDLAKLCPPIVVIKPEDVVFVEEPDRDFENLGAAAAPEPVCGPRRDARRLSRMEHHFGASYPYLRISFHHKPVFRTEAVLLKAQARVREDRENLGRDLRFPLVLKKERVAAPGPLLGGCGDHFSPTLRLASDLAEEVIKN